MNDYRARSVAEFCDAVGIKKTKFYDLVKRGDLKVVKVGRRTLVKDEDARAWLDGLTPVRMA